MVTAALRYPSINSGHRTGLKAVTQGPAVGITCESIGMLFVEIVALPALLGNGCWADAKEVADTVTEILMPHTYILKCGDASYYVGSTWDLERRLGEHQSGIGAKHTATRLPVELVYAEEYERIEDAFRREKQIQKWSRAKKEALIARSESVLPILAKKIFHRGHET